jgi:hypothetical protein
MLCLSFGMNSCIHAGLRWLAISGIQNQSGGVSEGFHADTRTYSPISTTATGYYIAAQLWSQRFSRGALPATASRAGSFLLEHAFNMSAEMFPVRVGDNDEEEAHLAYFLDCTVVVRSLTQLWDSTKDPAFLECAERCGLALHSRMPTVDGAFFPIYDFKTDRAYAEVGSWREEMGVPQLKGGLALLELYKATGRGEFEHDAEALRKWCLRRHESFLPGEVDDAKIIERLHAYCLFLEGLLPGVALDADSGRILQFGILRVENFLDEFGPELQRCDVLAQILRLRLYADKLGLMELDYKRAEDEAAAIVEFQTQSADPKSDGAFTRYRHTTNSRPQLDLTATVFAMQALEMWDQAEEGGLRDPWEVLI